MTIPAKHTTKRSAVDYSNIILYCLDQITHWDSILCSPTSTLDQRRDAERSKIHFENQLKKNHEAWQSLDVYQEIALIITGSLQAPTERIAHTDSSISWTGWSLNPLSKKNSDRGYTVQTDGQGRMLVTGPGRFP